jgi:hypothetical protein
MEWYLTRSKVIRFITKIYASSINVPPFLWKQYQNYQAQQMKIYL